MFKQATSATGHKLPREPQATETLPILATAAWSNVTTTVQDDGTAKTPIVDPPTGNRYYRSFKT